MRRNARDQALEREHCVIILELLEGIPALLGQRPHWGYP